MKKTIIIFVIFIILILLLSTYMIFIEPNIIIYENFEKQVPLSVEKCKIVFFSDTHLKGRSSMKQLKKVVDSINEQSADVVIFGGDFFDNYYRDKSQLELSEISLLLNEIDAKYSKFAVYGNHDYGGGAVRIYEKVMSGGGFTILRNESIMIKELKLNITGTDDFLLGDISDEMYQPFTDDFNLIITHSPDVSDKLDAENALILSGHSHGGQVKLPYITNKIMPKGARKYSQGLYTDIHDENKNFWLFVSKGVGTTGLPIRLFAPPDIVVVELKN